MATIVRFAPSPTGYLHIGGARTALVNYAFAKATGGKFLLRIEDTDKERSTNEYINTIFDSLKWLQIDYDDIPIIQSKRIARHTQVAHELCEKSNAYYCFCTQDELDKRRADCDAQKIPYKYDQRCRNLSEKIISQKLKEGLRPTVRIKITSNTHIEVNDMIKGNVKVDSKELDDFILLRSDNTPTYMLSVVVDDHDTNITHVIRGDDHFTNTFRQIALYNACNWIVPQFGHLPLIYGTDGKKLSKRYHAVGTDDYKKLGYLPEALKIYLATLGYNSCTVYDTFDHLIETFDIKKISKSPTQFDISFLNIINQKIIKSDKKYLSNMIPFIIDKLKLPYKNISQSQYEILLKAYDDIVSRCKNFTECADLATLYFYPDDYDKTNINKEILSKLQILDIDCTSYDTINNTITEFIKNNNFKRGDVLGLLRIVLSGRQNSPNVFNIMYCIGKNEVINRIKLVLQS